MIRLALAATALLGASRAANAQWVVFDPTNFAQNVVTAAKAVQGEIYQNTNIIYQYQMMANQLLQAKNLSVGAMKAQYDEIAGDIDKAGQLNSTLSNLYGDLNNGSQWVSHVQALISRSGKTNAQWFADMNTLYNQNDQAAKNLFQMGNNVMEHVKTLAQRRSQLQSEMATSPTAQATAEITTHYLDVVSSQLSDMLQMMAAKNQVDSQQQGDTVQNEKDRTSAAQNFITQQNAERAAYGVSE